MTKPFSVILLSGGIGSRMQTSIPKQYLLVENKPLALYSFEVFNTLPEVEEIIVVCEQSYEFLFSAYSSTKKICFARPGKRRQDSLFSGLKALTCEKEEQLVCIHDAARPLINAALVKRAVEAAEEWNAAVVGIKVKSTIKICDDNQLVVNTLDRSYLWEMQTPQVIRIELLKEAFGYVNSRNLTVTDDVSLVEIIGKKVKIVEGSYQNIKITTPEDIILVQQLLKNNDLL